MMRQFACAGDLPEEWDEGLGDNLYLSRDFLTFLESVDDSPKQYCIFYDPDGRADTKCMLHSRSGYNLTMFSKLRTSITMNFVYFPLSVSRPAMVFGDTSKDEVATFLKGIKGYKMILNAPETYLLDGFARGLTCPRCVLDLRWDSFDGYLQALRSGYRRRYRKALERSAPLRFFWLEDNSQFDQRLYELYLEVFENSDYKLEKLAIDFFRGQQFNIFVLAEGDVPVGFVQLLENGPELIFEFVGFRHEKNRHYDIYMRMLLEIIRYGIEQGFQTIDFGQTADDAKLKLGCRYECLYALLHHSNPAINAVLGLLARHIQYRPLDESRFHIFREEPL